VSKRISSAGLFSSWIVILLFEDWIDFIVPSCVWVVVWEMRIKRRIPRREIRKVIFCNFMDFFFLESRATRVPFGQNFSQVEKLRFQKFLFLMFNFCHYLVWNSMMSLSFSVWLSPMICPPNFDEGPHIFARLIVRKPRFSY